jgi:hypothetical protein
MATVHERTVGGYVQGGNVAVVREMRGRDMLDLPAV